MELKGKKINVIGDSITEGVGTTGAEHRFCDILAARTGATVRNYGISGTRIAVQQVKKDNIDFGLDFVTRAPQMDADADIVVVFGGTNDFGHGDAPFGCFEDRTGDTFCGAVHLLCRELLERYPEAEIVFVTPTHRLNEDVPTGDNKPAPVGTLKQYVDMLKRICEFYSLPVLDLYAAGRIQPKVDVIREKYMPDGLHPSDAGNELIAERLLAFLKAL